ncbi:MAG: hypothetical protein FJ190_05195 [Gammaproteobacteria bacterium]|nr:hypothetical protein [Gammaproteobacteria bacterium]
MRLSTEPIMFACEFLGKNVMYDDAIANIKSQTNTELEHVGKALLAATENPDTNDFDVLITLIVACLRNGEFMPEEFRHFVADVLEGNRQRPTKRGADKYKNWERDYKLCRAVQEVAKTYDLPHYSNNEFSEKTTAATIVAEASGLKIDVVINAYKNFNHYKPGVK